VAACEKYLATYQEPDGSWFGRWGITYLYGTWCALRGLAAVGHSTDSLPFRRGLSWLLSAQNEDGGFGESARSDACDRYVPLNRSTPSQTAWAAMALATRLDAATRPAWRRAIDWLVANQEEDGRWQDRYPTGAGSAGKIYLHYHSYAQVWPIHALAEAVRVEDRADG
jgi:sporulenol synthase